MELEFLQCIRILAHTNILKEFTASIFRADLKWNVPPKHWYIFTTLHAVAFQKTVILTSNLK
jgi:hypothetical protein